MVDSRVIIGGALSSMFLLIVGAILAYFFIYTEDGKAMIDPNYYDKKAEEERLQKEKEDKEKADKLKSAFESSSKASTASTAPVAPATTAPVAPVAPVAPTLAPFTPKESQIRSRRKDNFCLDVPGASMDNVVQLEAWSCEKGKVNQMFTLDDKKRLVAKHSGKCVGVANSQTANGTKVIQFDCLDKDDQKWEYSSTGELRPIHAKDKCLELFGGSDANGTPLVVWDCHGGDNQKWYV